MLSLIHLSLARFSGSAQVVTRNKSAPFLSDPLIKVGFGTVVHSKNCS